MDNNGFYKEVFTRFIRELDHCSSEIFMYPLPFTQVNRLAMLAATVAVKCLEELNKEPDGDDPS